MHHVEDTSGLEEKRKLALARLLQHQLFRKAISIRAAAKQCRVSTSHFAKILRREVPLPVPATLEKLAVGLGLPCSQLLHVAGRMKGSIYPFVTAIAASQFPRRPTDEVRRELLVGFFQKEGLSLEPVPSSLANACETLPLFHLEAAQFVRAALQVEEKSPYAWIDALYERFLALDHESAVDVVYYLAECNQKLHRLDLYLFLCDLIPEQFYSIQHTPIFARKLDQLREVFEDVLSVLAEEGKSAGEAWEPLCRTLDKIGWWESSRLLEEGGEEREGEAGWARLSEPTRSREWGGLAEELGRRLGEQFRTELVSWLEASFGPRLEARLTRHVEEAAVVQAVVNSFACPGCHVVRVGDRYASVVVTVPKESLGDFMSGLVELFQRAAEPAREKEKNEGP